MKWPWFNTDFVDDTTYILPHYYPKWNTDNILEWYINNNEYLTGKKENKNMRHTDTDTDDILKWYINNNDDAKIFYDVGVFPNLLLVCWKAAGQPKEKAVRWYNPTPDQISELVKLKLIGFNNRRYDNHILYARMMGYDNEHIFKLSQRIINKSTNAMFGEAYNLSYADVYDYSSVKQSLKKWKIALGIFFHVENEYPWDEPLPEDKWEEVGDYCVNDVMAIEAVSENREQDFVAREILADLSGLTVGHTTRQHATRIIFGDNKNPDLLLVCWKAAGQPKENEYLTGKKENNNMNHKIKNAKNDRVKNMLDKWISCGCTEPLIPKMIKHNGPATIVFWADGTKTVVKANPDLIEEKRVCYLDESGKRHYKTVTIDRTDDSAAVMYAFVKRWVCDNEDRKFHRFLKVVESRDEK